LGKEDYLKLIERFEEEMVDLKKYSKEYSKSHENYLLSNKDQNDAISRSRQAVESEQRALLNSVFIANETLMGRMTYAPNSTNSESFGGSRHDDFGKN
jgi:hypothetical protein